jgi:membrane-associated phospholipid phosphatase
MILLRTTWTALSFTAFEADGRGAGVARPAAGLAACVVALAGLAWLAFDVPAFAHFEVEVLSGISAEGGSWLGRVAELLVHLGDPGPLLLLTALACLAGLIAGRARESLAAAVVVAGANATTLVLKGALAQPRIYPELASHQIVSTAFPSGHATAVASLAVAFALVAPPGRRLLVGVIAGGFAFLASVSLLVLGVHFLSDVVAGWLVVVAWGCAAVAALRLASSPRRAGASSSHPPHVERL